MSKVIVNGTEVDIYAVGILRDFKEWQRGTRGKGFKGIKTALRWLKNSWRRKSYWNGYLAEGGNKGRCGTGWTKSAALRSWKRIPEL